MRKSWLAVVVVLAACSSSRPAYDAKLVAPQVKGLTVGVSTLDDVIKAFPGATISKDKSLGGEETVMYNDHKAIAVRAEGFESYIIDGKLYRFDMKAPGACQWLISTVGELKGSSECPGNRKVGTSKDRTMGTYCASAGDKVIWMECSGDSIQYRIGD